MLTYNLTRDDYVAFIEHLRRPYRYAPLRISLILFLGMVLPIWMVATWQRPPGVLVYYIAFMPLVCFAVVMTVMKVMLTRMNQRLLAEELVTAFCGERELALEPDGLREQAKSRAIRHLWPSIEQLTKNDHYLFVHSSAHVVTLIPRRAFATDREFNELAQKIAERSGKKILAEGR